MSRSAKETIFNDTIPHLTAERITSVRGVLLCVVDPFERFGDGRLVCGGVSEQPSCVPQDMSGRAQTRRGGIHELRFISLRAERPPTQTAISSVRLTLK
ncbi:hypothetical protein AAFF_G00173010 [Aldrovandia affinis]|uniref:Uncharacterized protein n=1 Tax=Aldrovandia affinis TaxID=143900 RepID=A0AAD7SZ29_9TELE|nr:hypothetical protein AAFF_G00173010 [Aldrovandia affinis]